MQKKKFQRLTAVLLAILMMVSLAAIAGAEETEDIVRDADVTVPDEGNVLVAFRGSAAVKSEKQAGAEKTKYDINKLVYFKVVFIRNCNIEYYSLNYRLHHDIEAGIKDISFI